MLIDCHTHAFADKIADRAIAHLSDYYKIQIPRGGRFGDLLAAAEEVRLDAFILLVAATRPEQVRPANDWILRLAGLSADEIRREFGVSHVPRVVPFGTFHPGDSNWLTEIKRLRAAGIKGIKLHPEFQGFDLANPVLHDFFAEVERDFVLLVHIGDRVVAETNFSTPRKVAAILDNFPKARVVAAHMGGYRFWDSAYEVLAGRDVYLDTSSVFPHLDIKGFQRLVSKHGTGRILFGSDFPVSSPQLDLNVLNQIEWLTDAEKQRIRGENCAELLGLTPPQKG